MPARDTIPAGAPCWVDLLTSDPERSRDFYGQVFGWTSTEPAEQFGGYFNFAKDGVLVAGGMPKQPGMEAPDTWSVYLATDDAQKTIDAATAHGGQILVPAMEVADLGTMGMVSDAGGAAIGIWQPGLHKGFGIVAEEGAPGWFEVYTRDYDATIAFYRDVFGWTTQTVGDTPEFRYTVALHGTDQIAGIMDGSAFLPEGVPAHWRSTSAPRTPTPRWPRSPAWAARSSGPRRTRRTAGWPRQPTRAASTSRSSPRTRRCPRGSPEPRKTRGRRPAVPDRRAAAPDRTAGLPHAGVDWRHGGGADPRLSRRADPGAKVATKDDMHRLWL